MKKMLVLVIAVLMIIGVNGLVTGCGKEEPTKIAERHGWYGDKAWSTCESAHDEYEREGYEVSEIMDEYLYDYHVYYFYTYTIAE